MLRLRLFALLTTLVAALGSLRAADAPAAVDYFLPVRYDMVISRSVAQPDTATSRSSSLVYELFTSRDLLRSILSANEVTDLTDWTLVARGNTSAFSDPRTTDTLSTLTIVARNRKTGQVLAPTSDIAIGFTEVRATVAYARQERQDDPDNDTNTPGTVVNSSTRLGRIAILTQKLPLRGDYPAGTLVTTGLIEYTNVYGKVSVEGTTTAEPVLRPNGGVYRAAGTYTEDGGSETDGLAEILITFGTPVFRIPEEG